MAYEDSKIVQDWLNALRELDVEVKRCLAAIAYIAIIKLLAGFMTAS